MIEEPEPEDQMPKTAVRWYVYPLSPETNSRISEMLDTARSMTEIHCADGRRRPVWECDKEFVSILRNNSAMKVWVYRMENNGRVVRDMGKARTKRKYGDMEKLKAKLESMKPKRRPGGVTAS